MKKAMLFMLCLMATTLAFAQKDLTNSQLKVRTEILNFLKEEGFTPEIDSDGDIKFKRQGGVYFVVISDANTSPMYVALEEYVSVPDRYSETVLRLASERLTERYKAIKCNYMASSKTLRLAGEMFLRSAEAFKEVFYKLVSVMDTVEDKIIETCDEQGGSVGSGNNIQPLTISKVEIGNIYKDGTIETAYGATIYADKTMYLKPRITYTGNKGGDVTLKVKFFTADGTLSTSSKSPTGFSYETSVSLQRGSGNTVELSGWGGEDKGHWKAGNYRLEVWYEDACLKRQEFEVVENEDDSMEYLLDLMAEGMKEAYGGLPASVSVGNFNIEINDIEPDVETTSVVLVFRMPKSKSLISEDDKEMALIFCNAAVKGGNDELKKNDDLKSLGLESMKVTYRLEDKYGYYIAGVKK